MGLYNANFKPLMKRQTFENGKISHDQALVEIMEKVTVQQKNFTSSTKFQLRFLSCSTQEQFICKYKTKGSQKILSKTNSGRMTISFQIWLPTWDNCIHINPERAHEVILDRKEQSKA